MLLDNGRTAALADQVGRAALHCIRCSACLNVCPVYERTGGHAYGSVYPGPDRRGAVPAAHRACEDNASLPYASSLCGACYDVCPVKIDIPDPARPPARRARRGQPRPRVPTPEARAMAAAAWVMADPRRFAGAEQAAGPAGCSAAAADRIRALPPPLSAGRASRDLPAPPPETFREWWAARGRRRMSARERGAAPDPRRALRRPPGRRRCESPRDYRTARRAPAGRRRTLVELLVDRLVDYRADGPRAAPDELPATRRGGARRRAAGRGRRRRPACPRLAARTARSTTTPAHRAELDRVDAVVTGVRRRHRRDRHDRPRRLARPGPPRHHPGARLPRLRRARRPGRRRPCPRLLAAARPGPAR